jgi:hypothetical protein
LRKKKPSTNNCAGLSISNGSGSEMAGAFEWLEPIPFVLMPAELSVIVRRLSDCDIGIGQTERIHPSLKASGTLCRRDRDVACFGSLSLSQST